MRDNLCLKIASAFIGDEHDVMCIDEIFWEHSDTIQWFTERNCKLDVDRIEDPSRFGWVYHITARDITREIYLEYHLTWK